jgi:tetratricopeptide (TPR) repeat protein
MEKVYIVRIPISMHLFLGEYMATREEIITLVSYVLGDKNRQILVAEGLEALPKETRITALRGLQDLGWIGHSGMADFEESYSLTKDGRRTVAEHPSVHRLEPCIREQVEALRTVDGETNSVQRNGLKRLITVDCDLGNWDSALIHCFHLKRIAEQSSDTNMLAFALFHQGKVEVAQNRWEEALESYLNSNEKYVECGDSRGVAITNRAMGVIYAHKGDHASAIRCFESSLSMARMIGDGDLEAKAEGNLANVYDLEGRYDEAEKAHKKCLEYFLKSNDLAGAARTANNLGVLNLLQERFQAAAEYFEKTIESCRKIKNREVLGIALVNCGYSYGRCGNVSRSIAYTDEAVSILKEPNDLNLLALAYRNYGCVEMRSLRPETAFDWFERSVRAAKASGVEDTLAACCYEYGMSLIHAATDIRLAKKLLKRSASLFRNMGNADKAKYIESALAMV